MNKETRNSKPVVALFVTCLVDLFRPSVAFATIKLLESYGCRVVIPKSQSCCGQPAYNSGDYDGLKSHTEGSESILKYLSEQNLGEKKVTYRLRDWLISRQRYWGCPIPIINSSNCG